MSSTKLFQLFAPEILNVYCTTVVDGPDMGLPVAALHRRHRRRNCQGGQGREEQRYSLRTKMGRLCKPDRILCVLPNLITNLVSYRTPCHILYRVIHQAGKTIQFLRRYFIAFEALFQADNTEKDNNYSALFNILHSCLENAPQIVLQMYIIITTWGDDGEWYEYTV